MFNMFTLRKTGQRITKIRLDKAWQKSMASTHQHTRGRRAGYTIRGARKLSFRVANPRFLRKAMQDCENRPVPVCSEFRHVPSTVLAVFSHLAHLFISCNCNCIRKVWLSISKKQMNALAIGNPGSLPDQ